MGFTSRIDENLGGFRSSKSRIEGLMRDLKSRSPKKREAAAIAYPEKRGSYAHSVEDLVFDAADLATEAEDIPDSGYTENIDECLEAVRPVLAAYKAAERTLDKSRSAAKKAAAEEAAEAAFADLLHYGPRLQHLVADCLNALLDAGIVEEDEDEDEDDYDDY
jgi:hypothetical protein